MIEKTYQSTWNKEFRKRTILGIRESIRVEYDKLVGRLKGAEDALVKLEGELKEAQKAVQLSHGEDREKKQQEEKAIQEKVNLAKEMAENLKKDSQTMKEQMMGKWSEKTQQYEAGIDQEVKLIEGQIGAGLMLIEDIKKFYDEV